MFKKIFYGLLVAAMLGGMTSCSSSPVGNEDDIIVPEDTASVGTVRFNLAGIDDGKTRAPQAIDFDAYKVEMLVYEEKLDDYGFKERIEVVEPSFTHEFSKGTYKFIFLAYTNNTEDGKKNPKNNFVGNLSTGLLGIAQTELSDHILLTDYFEVYSELFQAQTGDITVKGEGILGEKPEDITIPNINVDVTLTRISGAVKFSLAVGSLVGLVDDGEPLTFSATIGNAPNKLVLETSGIDDEKTVTTSGDGKAITLEKQFTYQKDSPAQFILNTLPFETAQNATFSFKIKKGDQELVSKSIEEGLLYVKPNTYTLLEYDGKSLNMSIELEDGVWDGPNP